MSDDKVGESVETGEDPRNTEEDDEKTETENVAKEVEEDQDGSTGRTEEKPVIKLTLKAAEMVKKIMAAEGVPEGTQLRVRVGVGCAGFNYDIYFNKGEVAKADRLIVTEGVEIVIDESSLTYIVGTEIDYVEGSTGTGFKFNNPNSSGLCGSCPGACGPSSDA